MSRLKRIIAKFVPPRKPKEPSPAPWWWLSFADDEGFRGAVVVRANDIGNAVMLAHRHNINPGGEVLAVEVPARLSFDPEDTYTLLDKVNAQRVDDALTAQADNFGKTSR